MPCKPDCFKLIAQRVVSFLIDSLTFNDSREVTLLYEIILEKLEEIMKHDRVELQISYSRVFEQILSKLYEIRPFSNALAPGTTR